MYRLFLMIAALAVLLLGCSGERTISVDEFNTEVVTLPDGYQVRAEVMREPEDMMRGMMFRDSLAEDRGMLFMHGSPGEYTYYMYQVRIPLDLIWMDLRGRVVEIVADAPPCTTKASKCPQYGGHEVAAVVLELPAGSAAKHNVRVGSKLKF